MKKGVIVMLVMAAVFLFAFAVSNEISGERRSHEAECRQLMDEYEEAVAKGDKTGANRAAAMYNDYMFSYASLWNGDIPKGLKHRLSEVE